MGVVISGGGSSSGSTTIDGLHHVDGDEITVSLGNLTYLVNDQVGSDYYAIADFVSKAAGRSELSFLTWLGSIVTSGKLDLDIVFWDSAPTTTSSDGDTFDLSAANLAKYQGHVEIREHHWISAIGTTDLVGQVGPNELGHEIKCVATSAYFSVIWRGNSLAVGSSETLKFKFGTRYLDA